MWINVMESFLFWAPLLAYHEGLSGKVYIYISLHVSLRSCSQVEISCWKTRQISSIHCWLQLW